MNCAEFQELAAAYALDALPEEERLLCLHHLEHEGPHEGCEALVARFERTVDELAAAVSPVALPPSLWRAIEARLGLGAAAGATVHTLPGKPQAQGARWREGLAWATAAAALLGALWSHQTAQRTASTAAEERVTLEHKMEESLANTSGQLASVEAARKACTTALAQLTQQSALGRDAVSLLELPDTQLAAMAPTAAQPYRATALYNGASKRAVIISTTLKPVDGKDYELWVIAQGPGQAPQAAGFIRFDASGVAIGEFDAALLGGRAPAALAVSLEPAGGRPTPTEVVLLGKLKV